MQYWSLFAIRWDWDKLNETRTKVNTRLRCSNYWKRIRLNEAEQIENFFFLFLNQLAQRKWETQPEFKMFKQFCAWHFWRNFFSEKKIEHNFVSLVCVRKNFQTKNRGARLFEESKKSCKICAVWCLERKCVDGGSPKRISFIWKVFNYGILH